MIVRTELIFKIFCNLILLFYLKAGNMNDKKDFIHKLGIAQKEAFETQYWVRLLTAADYNSSGKLGIPNFGM